MPKTTRTQARIRAASRASSTLTDAIETLKSEELVVYPTETFYGLGADPFSPAALARLFAAKQREAGKPVGLIAADTRAAFSIAREIPATARMLADAFWPGPLTIVMAARAGIAAELLGADGGVAVRVSSHPVARALAAGLGHPVTATSANRSGEPPASRLAEARAAFGAKVKVYLEGGTLEAAAPSTVISVVGGNWRVLRAGAISERDLAATLASGALK